MDQRPNILDPTSGVDAIYIEGERLQGRECGECKRTLKCNYRLAWIVTGKHPLVMCVFRKRYARSQWIYFLPRLENPSGAKKVLTLLRVFR